MNEDILFDMASLAGGADLNPAPSPPARRNFAAKLVRIVYWVLKNNKEYQTQPN
ncbi:MAG TPA: hypothetical protein VKL21_09115 [Candidatus Methanoperedens sp.]|nr:hypothetical protein [Candidatus Methanoperedens sp.]